MDLQCEIIPSPKMEVIEFSIQILVRPGKKVPSVRTIKKILNENLDPHIGFDVMRSSHA